MKFLETLLKGAFVIEIDPNEDERGFFARTFCEKEFKDHGIHFKIAQTNISFNRKKGTLRGMHYQAKPHEEAKLVQCIRGEIYDVIIDLRTESSSFKEWCAVSLSQKNRKMLFIPEGFAHGFQTLEDNTEIFYLMSNEYQPGHSRGVLWSDEAFGISWPMLPPILSEKDAAYVPLV